MSTNGTCPAGYSSTVVPNPPVGAPKRKDVDDTFSKFASVIHAANRPLPNRYGYGQEGGVEQEQTGYLKDFAELRRGGFLLESAGTLWEQSTHARKGGPTDDKTMIVGCHLRFHG